MSGGAASAGAGPPRLNPFAFPSDTDLRFVLLVVAVVAASFFGYQQLSVRWTAELVAAQTACEARADAEQPLARMLSDLSNVDSLGARLERLDRRGRRDATCYRPLSRAEGGWAVAGAALVLACAGAIVWALPAWRIRRDKLKPVATEPGWAPMLAYLDGLCREAGLGRPPTFLCNPTAQPPTGLAFGRPGRHYVVLNMGLVTRFRRDRPQFRAVVLHELAHLRNRDLLPTYFAVAAWWGFVAAVLVPLALYQVESAVRYGPGTLRTAGALGSRMLALGAIVYLSRAAVLRSREVYADVRASVWDGPAGALRRILASPLSASDRRRPTVLRVHPDPQDRLAALDDTGRLFGLGWWEAFGVGLAATIALPTVARMLHDVRVSIPGSTLLGKGHAAVAAFLLTPLAVGVAGIGVWRAAFAAHARGEALRGVGRLALCLALGVAVGDLLSFDRYYEGMLPALWLRTAGRRLPWAVLVFALFYGALRWVAAAASVWLEVATTQRAARYAAAASLAVASGAAASGLHQIFDLRDSVLFFAARASGTQAAAVVGLVLLPTLQSLATHPAAVLTVVATLAVPFGAWLAGRRSAARRHAPAGGPVRRDWAVLDPSAEAPTPSPRPPLDPHAAVRIGLAFGAAFWVLLLVVRMASRLTVSESVRDTVAFKVGLLWIGMTAPAVALQAVAASVVARRAARLAVLHGLLAAFTVAAVAAAGSVVLNLVFGGGATPGFVWMVFAPMVTVGALFAAPVAAVGSADVLRRRA